VVRQCGCIISLDSVRSHVNNNFVLFVNLDLVLSNQFLRPIASKDIEPLSYETRGGMVAAFIESALDKRPTVVLYLVPFNRTLASDEMVVVGCI
jgi:hypothetical protein